MSGDSGAGQLDFYEAMQDFTQMFPYMDCEVIEAVLRANNGAVDATIDQLLTMNQGGGSGKTSTDQTQTNTPQDKDATAAVPTEMESSTDYVNTENFDVPPALPPKQKRSPKKVTIATQRRVPPASQHDLDTDSSDLMDASIADIMNLPPAPPRPKFNANSAAFKTPAQPIPHFRHGVPDAPIAKNPVPMEEKTKGHRCRSKSTPLEFYKKSLKPVNLYAKWKPALLGELPEDFLRLDISPKPEEQQDKTDGSRHRRRHTVGHKSLTHMHGGSHHGNSHHGNSSRTPDLPSEQSDPLVGLRQKVRQHASHHGDGKYKHRLEKTGPSPLSTSHLHKTQARMADRKLHLGRHREHATLHDGRGGTIQAQQQAQNMEWLIHKLAENERRRCELDENDHEMAQYLQDEYLALMLQNSEFLEELTRDTDFMQTLDKDSRRIVSAQDIVPTPMPHVAAPPPLDSPTSRPYTEEPQIDVNMLAPEEVEGYGVDNQKDLPAFPHDREWPDQSHNKTPEKSHDQHLELRQRLENMGSSSKKKFLDIARKFFSLKRKQPSKPLYKNHHTPSTMNLLLEEEVPESSLQQTLT